MNLKDGEVKSAKPQEKPYKMADGTGLYLLVRASGLKVWRFRYKQVADGLDQPGIPIAKIRTKLRMKSYRLVAASSLIINWISQPFQQIRASPDCAC